jgi:CDP-diglyceride synthetase
MYNWDPFSIVKYVSGSPIGNISTILTILIFWCSPSQDSVTLGDNYFKNKSILVMFACHILCLVFSVCHQFLNNVNIKDTDTS